MEGTKKRKNMILLIKSVLYRARQVPGSLKILNWSIFLSAGWVNCLVAGFWKLLMSESVIGSKSGWINSTGLKTAEKKITESYGSRTVAPKMASGSERTPCPSISVKADGRFSTEQIYFLVGNRDCSPDSKCQGLACLPWPLEAG